MIAYQPLHSPGEASLFDPLSNSVGLPFDIEELLPDLTKPYPEKWRNNWELFHEWCHFYQFSTTTYGFFYQALNAAQLLMINGFLRIYDPKYRRCRLPLLAASEDLSVTQLVSQSHEPDPPWLIHLALIGAIDRYRSAVYGYGPTPNTDDALSADWRTMIEFLHDQFGVPRQLIFWPNETRYLQAWRFRIEDLLESHALALASLWILEAVERHDLPPRISREVIDYADLSAIGPYGAFLKHSPDLPADPKWRTHLFCMLCDLALNPPPYDSQTQSDALVYMADSTWAPVTRLWSLVLLAKGGKLRAPSLEEYRGQQQFLAEFKETLEDLMGLQASQFLPYESTSRPTVMRMINSIASLGQMGDIPDTLGFTLMDNVATYLLAEEARKDQPLLLGGDVIEDLGFLFRSIAGPSTVCKHAGRYKVYSRICTGLIWLGIIDIDPSNELSDHVVRNGIPAIETLRMMLYRSRSEIESQTNQPLFGPSGPNFSESLAWYGLDLSDFD